MADIILLNKSDLVEPSFLSSLSGRIRSVNSLAPITATKRAEIPLGNLLGLRGFELESVEHAMSSMDKRSKHMHEHPEHVCSPECDHDHDHDHDHHYGEAHSHSHSHAEASSNHEEHSHDHSHSHAEASHSHSHDHDHDHGECAPGCTNPDHDHSHDHSHAKPMHNDKVTSFSISVEGDMDLDKLNFTMGALLQSRGEDLYRMKGILSIRGLPERYVFQGVHMLFEGSPERAWRDDEPRISRMVFIGREIDQEALAEAFRRCLADPPVVVEDAKGQAVAGAAASATVAGRGASNA
jgi:G3E family GTPase